MRTYHYKLYFSPFSGVVKAKNKKKAMKKIIKMYPEYNIKKVLQYLS